MRSMSAVTRSLLAAAACAVTVHAVGTAPAPVLAQAGPQGRGGGGGDSIAAQLFTLLDGNRDGGLTRGELKSALDTWYTQWDASKSNAIGLEQVFIGLNSAFPASSVQAAPPQNRTPRPEIRRAHV